MGKISRRTLVVGAASAGLLGAFPVKGHAATSLASFVMMYLGKRVADPNGYYVGECVSLVKRYHTEVVAGKNFSIPNGAASGMWTQYSQISQLTAAYDQAAASGSALRGDIAVFGGGKYGHVAVVLADAAATATTLRVFEQNSPLGAAAKETPDKSKTNLLGYLRPRGSAGAAGNNVLALAGDGTLYGKQGGLSTGWLTLTNGIASARLSGNNLLALTTGGTLLGKEGGLSTGWLTLTGGIKAFDISGNNVLALAGDGTLYGKQGGLSTGWLTLTNGIASARLSGNNLLALTTGGTLLGKEGGLSTGWLTLTGGIKAFDISGNNVLALAGDGTLYGKQGGLSTGWLTLTNGIASAKLSGNSLLALTTGGTLLGKEGGLSTGWLTLTGGIKAFDIG